MSSSKNRGRGGAKKPRPKQTTAKKTAPEQTPRGQATTPSVPAQATDDGVKAGEVTPEETLSPARQAVSDDETSASVESQPTEPQPDGPLTDESPTDDASIDDVRTEDAMAEDAESIEAPRDPEAPVDGDRAPADIEIERPNGAAPASDPSEPPEAEPVEQASDDARPPGPSGTTAAVPSPDNGPAGAEGRGGGVDEPERTDGIEVSKDGAETPDADAPSEGGRRKVLGKVFAALLAVGLGFAVMTQVRQTEKSGLDKLSQADLVALLADVNAQSSRLNTELDELRATKQKLDSGGDSAAVADAQKRLDQLSVLNGTTKVKGPGIVISVVNTQHEVTAANVLDAVEELRDAGAESIEVDGTRVVASTWFSDEDHRPTVEGRALNDTFTIRAIGDPHTMSTAMAIPGGVTDTLTQAGAQVKVTEDTSMQINSVVASTR